MVGNRKISSEEGFYFFFNKTFLPIYADLVAVSANKPTQILIEIENSLSHLAASRMRPNDKNDNFKKAKDHIRRASLDAAKMLWLEHKKRLNRFISDDHLRNYCVKCREDEFVRRYSKADDLVKEARVFEVMNVGASFDDRISKYYGAAQAYGELLEMVDPEALRKYKTFKIGYMIKRHGVDFGIGVIAGIIAAYLFGLLKSPL